MTRAAKYVGRPCLRGHDGLRYRAGGICVECTRERGRRRWDDPAVRDRSNKQRRAAYSERDRDGRYERTLKRCYGLSLEGYSQMHEEQEGRCAICSVESWAIKGRLNVDHDHATGAVRGLLCHKCNVAVGLCDDDPVRLEKAAYYLRQYGK